MNDMETQQTFQQLPKTELGVSGTPKNLLFGSAMLLLVAAALYLFCAGYAKVAQDQAVSLDQEIQSTVASLSKDEVTKVLTLDSQIRQLRILLPQHIAASRIFDMLEQNTLPKVTFTSMSFNTDTGSLQLSGTAQSLQDVSLQAAAFKQIPEVKDVAIKDIGITKNASTFNFKLDISIARSFVLPK
ncbi:MAG: hypothetical protein COV41_03080 [Candidatus Brennerbacteria bacterium CG11_big_fil_rev_8_21_14_0_20_43_10]|uniref:Uncharacterized protein n=3 Tax=Candidatus Brenneribacteriota TaxID=1817902 RepID=A0A2M8C3D0_9BACT|nr:MAG: hypothetical protein AUJ43_00380 [Parcubacteria group bacterium CG1_02_44_31]PIP50387.1 MAG: hypothetical protein COX12_01610 [Candidatus Brennerbacteria bacterium CG23_combo_of_CG06-09_8_20_14_all_44_41]PIR25343.1 MAG: hypothetical protein COV41_03080 [Candidatus Brennerbacteria bacterium CG11_big_fil_rev_8_21_14_0_20_43_10]PIX29186.1 MAG: hypothetical protein COZ64_00750 [Candidatus Brennerbacteria bacterium CG_4_8_14_3_um_filter_43_14]PJA19544.1 MAG: hypothetical protein COX61_00820 